MIREHDRGRALAEILEDRYVQNRLQSPEQRARLLDRPEVLQAVGGDKAQAAKAEVSGSADADRLALLAHVRDAERRGRAEPPARAPVETRTSTTIVITYGSAWKTSGGDRRRRAPGA